MRCIINSVNLTGNWSHYICIELSTLLDPYNFGAQANLKKQSWKKRCVSSTFAFLGQQKEETNAMGKLAITRYTSQSQGRSSAAVASCLSTPGCGRHRHRVHRRPQFMYILHYYPVCTRACAHTHTEWKRHLLIIGSVEDLPDKITQGWLGSLLYEQFHKWPLCMDFILLK